MLKALTRPVFVYQRIGLINQRWKTFQVGRKKVWTWENKSCFVCQANFSHLVTAAILENSSLQLETIGLSTSSLRHFYINFTGEIHHNSSAVRNPFIFYQRRRQRRKMPSRTRFEDYTSTLLFFSKPFIKRERRRRPHHQKALFNRVNTKRFCILHTQPISPLITREDLL